MTHLFRFMVCVMIVFGSCTKKKSELVWDVNFPVIGSQSSPRAVDLNQDGILDIVMGAGKNEFQYSSQGILAINGKNGQVLWVQEASDQVFGAATFLDVNGDGIKDIFIGGRSPHLKALDGKTGKVIWEYRYEFEDDPVLRHARFNFYNTVLVSDQNQDGMPELLTVNGGNVNAAPYSAEFRFSGVLMLLDSKTGDIIAADTMPDGKESYMSPLYFSNPDGVEQIIFGTGGETIGGNLYIANLSDLLNRGLSTAEIIASDQKHGFISPPVLADITGDGFLDVVAISHGSKIFAIDGKSRKAIWKQEIPHTESSNSFAVGYFTDDKILDFFTFVSKGEWPYNTGTLQIMVDGKDGRLAFSDSLGCTGFSSSVAFDLNHDGIEEVIMSLNEFDCSRDLTDQSSFNIVNKLVALDFKNKSNNIIDQSAGFKNIFSTPWIGDLDLDGYLDIVHLQYYSHTDLLSFLGMRIKRISTGVKVKNAPLWGAFMGSKGDGIYPVEE